MERRKEHILVVDDDAGLRDLLDQYLSGQGFEVTTAADGAAMMALLSAQAVDAVILDLMLPGENGLTLARQLRARSGVPIIMLSARGEDIDRIIGLEVGADDYLAKPFNPRELLARIRAVLRRRDPCPVRQEETPRGRTYAFGPFKLDLQSHHLSRDGTEIPITSGEFTLLRIFTEHPNRVLSRDYLVELLKGYERAPFDRSIDVRVARLRRKIENDPMSPAFIRTVWGQGYLFSPQGTAS